MKFRNKYIQLIFLVLTICLYYHIAFQIKRSEFGLLMFDITLLFLLYIFALKYFEFYWWLAILPRLVFITAIPGLSDDYFRFIWDGNLLVNGMNPYQYLPSSFPQNEVYEGLNSKNYYSVYPPLLQLFFGISAFFAKGSIFSNIICLRIFILFADLGSIFLINKILRYLKLPTKYALIYTLNPLIILELTGNLHFEAVSIFFLLLSFYYLQFIQYNETKYLLLSAIALAFAALIKLLPLIFLPLVFSKFGWKKGAIYSIITLSIVLVAFLPFINFEIISNISKSLNLYFQSFEFNASIYYVVKWLGIGINNNNPIQLAGPLLSMIGISAIFWLSFKNFGKRDFSIQFLSWALIVIAIYLFFATTVHPWYISTILCLVAFTKFKFPIIWSYLAFLSYSAYSSSQYNENLWLVSLEYIVVFGVIGYEIFYIKKANSLGF